LSNQHAGIFWRVVCCHLKLELLSFEKFKMAVFPLDLLAEVGNLSISDGCSRMIKDSKVRFG
jgi:hypothetical protein